jgi:hypothetical protein
MSSKWIPLLWTGLLLGAGGPGPAHGQQYWIDWHAVAGGGGTSSNSQYSLSVTVGQSDAIQMSGGGYFLTGGFWSLDSAAAAIGAPVFLAQAQSQTVGAGASVVLSVNVTGVSPIAYQWQFDGANIAGATGSALTVPAAQTTNAGNYAVVVSNSLGSVTSAATGLRVRPFLGCVSGRNGLTLTWPSEYVLQAATNAGGPYYDVPGVTSPCVLATTFGRQRFFRARGVMAGTVGPGSCLSNGQFGLQVGGLPGYNYMVQASTDLVSWLPLQTNPAPFLFVDTNAAGYRCRFYRTMLLLP